MLRLTGIVLAYIVGLLLTARSLFAFAAHLLFGVYPDGGPRLALLLAAGLLLLAAVAAADEDSRLRTFGRLLIYCCSLACLFMVAALARVYFERVPHVLKTREWETGLLCAALVLAVITHDWRRKAGRKRRQPSGG